MSGGGCGLVGSACVEHGEDGRDGLLGMLVALQPLGGGEREVACDGGDDIGGEGGTVQLGEALERSASRRTGSGNRRTERMKCSRDRPMSSTFVNVGEQQTLAALGRARILAGLFGRAEALADPERWDAVLLDVDNGPSALVDARNDRLYAAGGLAELRAALRPAGALATWGAADDAGYAARLREAGFTVERGTVPARGRPGDPDHTLWLARRRPGPAH